MSSKECFGVFIILCCLAVAGNIIIGSIYGFNTQATPIQNIFSGLLLFVGICFWAVSIVKLFRG